MSPLPTRFFARTTAGTEELAAGEIAGLPGARVTGVPWRRVDLDTGDPRALLGLRSVDDVYAYVGDVAALDHTRAALANLARQIGPLPWREALGVCGRVRAIPRRPTYAVTASMVGPRRNYSRYDVAEAVRAGMPPALGWTYVDQRDRATAPELDVRVLLEGDGGLVGIRLGERPLHRRAYKLENLPGSLKPPVAYCMARLAGIGPGDLVLDPACGAGTIAIESATAFSGGSVLAADLDPVAVRAAARNAREAAAPVGLLVGDAARLPLPDGSVARIVCNLPWGRQAGAPEGLARAYALFVGEFARVLAEDGRIVLLTDQTPLLWAPLERSGRLRLTLARQISLYGSHPTLVVLTTAPLPPPSDTWSVALRLRALQDGATHPDPTIRAWASEAAAARPAAG